MSGMHDTGNEAIEEFPTGKQQVLVPGWGQTATWESEHALQGYAWKTLATVGGASL